MSTIKQPRQILASNCRCSTYSWTHVITNYKLSFLPQSLDRFQAGGLARGIESGGDARESKAGDGEDGGFWNEPRRIEAAGTVVIAKQRHGAAGQSHADESANQREENAFG